MLDIGDMQINVGLALGLKTNGISSATKIRNTQLELGPIGPPMLASGRQRGGTRPYTSAIPRELA